MSGIGSAFSFIGTTAFENRFCVGVHIAVLLQRNTASHPVIRQRFLEISLQVLFVNSDGNFFLLFFFQSVITIYIKKHFDYLEVHFGEALLSGFVESALTKKPFTF